jgi:hypothetical protein
MCGFYCSKDDINQMLSYEVGRHGYVGGGVSHLIPVNISVSKDASNNLVTHNSNIVHPNFDDFVDPAGPLPRQGINYDDYRKQVFYGDLTFTYSRETPSSLGLRFNFEVFNYFAKDPSLFRINRNSYVPVLYFPNIVFTHIAMYDPYGRATFNGYMMNTSNV